MTEAQYQSYLAGKSKCAVCGQPGALQVFELTERDLAELAWTDLRAFCEGCADIGRQLIRDGEVEFDRGASHHSRFATIKAAIKKYRFGKHDISSKEIAKLQGANSKPLEEACRKQAAATSGTVPPVEPMKAAQENGRLTASESFAGMTPTELEYLAIALQPDRTEDSALIAGLRLIALLRRRRASVRSLGYESARGDAAEELPEAQEHDQGTLFPYGTKYKGVPLGEIPSWYLADQLRWLRETPTAMAKFQWLACEIETLLAGGADNGEPGEPEGDFI